MKVFDKGHTYELGRFDGEKKSVLRFVTEKRGEKGKETLAGYAREASRLRSLQGWAFGPRIFMKKHEAGLSSTVAR